MHSLPHFDKISHNSPKSPEFRQILIHFLFVLINDKMILNDNLTHFTFIYTQFQSFRHSYSFKAYLLIHLLLFQ